MWFEILKYREPYESAVLTALADDGYPFTIRCRPQPDEANKTLRLVLLFGVELTTGPACLLWHRHDDRLWKLNSFTVRGQLLKENKGWTFRPETFILGGGIGGWRSYARFLVNGRRTTRRYLERRGLPRPKFNWDEWDALIENT